MGGDRSAYDAIVLAGGAGSRLGGPDKPDHLVGGRSMLERVVASVAGARRVIVVGPERTAIGGVRWVLEDPPGGGPVAAVAAGLPATGEAVTLLLAADLPFVAAAIEPLLAALGRDDDAVALADAGGRINFLAAAWRTQALREAVAALPDPAGRPMRALGIPRAVPDPAGWGDDCDTPEQLAAARHRAGEE
ncbi:molybdopterin-guanine dinucleotide biosynthesis protein A [Branchiibius hedensis]|uniref:Molybdopterin-guanine dinucleotide biosynthesis protein A n=1 Tax=Branchiibius hedensis TaxID=672460 RepID=A0A2Y9C1N5_9MICO|nr:NTP transferase domain-containing protein [Branchiibius hedensis]PWJ25830.1 molybdopterin-guanine dinucleotide biosynthesis protein A [Branchiibius hedensis]SSA34643.1 Molybdopterin-guanine dinucleotide biosynthesis protein A [Branchiibius hedensis]